MSDQQPQPWESPAVRYLERHFGHLHASAVNTDVTKDSATGDAPSRPERGERS